MESTARPYRLEYAITARGDNDDKTMTGGSHDATEANQDRLRRTRVISLRVNEDEARELVGLAEQRGVTLSSFLIEAARQAGDIGKARQDAEQRPVVRELQHIRTEIWRIGHNVNQVAHNTNRDLVVSVEQETSVVAAVRECGELMERVSEIVRGAIGNHSPNAY
ncbi:plasmid mobilization protein [Bifidobacterium boum]|uniref:plasmid mobilization protein n=1 Tax=Bifidobacterium boum TaxID=78343 RepID=UPI003F901381